MKVDEEITEKILKKARESLGPDSIEAEEIELYIDGGDFSDIPDEYFPDEYLYIFKKMKEFKTDDIIETAKFEIIKGLTPKEVEISMNLYIIDKFPLLITKLKTIYLFHFKTAEQPDFDVQDKVYCKDYGQPYPYTIVYHTISDKISNEGFVKLKDEVTRIYKLDPKLNQILFYTEIHSDPVVDMAKKITLGESQCREFVRLLMYLKEYIENSVVFLYPNELRALPYNIFEENHIRVKKFLNIMLDSDHRGMKILESGGALYPYKFFLGKQDKKLICNEWFIYFSDIAFGCIKNRLIQIAGTCYLNAILNGIILSPLARNAALHSMKKEDAAEYSKPLNLDICEKKDSKYLFRLLYNTVCSKVPLHKSVYHKDIIIEFSKLYSPCPTGEGGKTIDTMTRILDLIDINHIILGYETFHPFPAVSMEPKVIIRPGSGDFLFVEAGGKVNDIVPFKGEWFDLEFSTISVQSAKTNKAHSVAGIKCEGNYIIFDSNDGVLNIDWRKLGVDKEVTNILIDYFRTTYNWDDVTAILMWPVYIRQSAQIRYSRMSSEELCDGLK
jgi:hypothetical protein